MQGVENPIENGLLFSLKWFHEYEFGILTFLKGGNQARCEKSNRQWFTVLA